MRQRARWDPYTCIPVQYIQDHDDVHLLVLATWLEIAAYSYFVATRSYRMDPPIPAYDPFSQPTGYGAEVSVLIT